MPERIINITILFTLALLAITLVAFGFDWVYQLWLADELSNGWAVSLFAIPVVAMLSALLLYLFCSAVGLADGREHTSYPYD